MRDRVSSLRLRSWASHTSITTRAKNRVYLAVVATSLRPVSYIQSLPRIIGQEILVHGLQEMILIWNGVDFKRKAGQLNRGSENGELKCNSGFVSPDSVSTQCFKVEMKYFEWTKVFKTLIQKPRSVFSLHSKHVSRFSRQTRWLSEIMKIQIASKSTNHYLDLLEWDGMTSGTASVIVICI